MIFLVFVLRRTFCEDEGNAGNLKDRVDEILDRKASSVQTLLRLVHISLIICHSVFHLRSPVFLRSDVQTDDCRIWLESRLTLVGLFLKHDLLCLLHHHRREVLRPIRTQMGDCCRNLFSFDRIRLNFYQSNTLAVLYLLWNHSRHWLGGNVCSSGRRPDEQVV